MRRVMVVATIVALASCGKQADVKSGVNSSDTFPQRGTYHVVHEVVHGSDSKTDEFDTELGGFDRTMLEAEIAKDVGSKCRDKQISIGESSFNVRMTCSAPDGDFNHIEVERDGSFSKDSFQMTTRSTLMGYSEQESFRARLKAS